MRHSLRTRISLLLTLFCALLLLAGGVLWVADTRDSIHEEMEAASRVTEQWLAHLAAPVHTAQDEAALIGQLRRIGRIRACDLEVMDTLGVVHYRSNGPTYKAGRNAPVWFSQLVAPPTPVFLFDAGTLQIRMTPSPSRAILDAWDRLIGLAAWAGLLLLTLFGFARVALVRTFAPFQQVMAALDETGKGRFDTRLPRSRIMELDRLAHSFNGMADRLTVSVNQNVQLECERALDTRLKQQLAAERRAMARELHDEMAQGITAVSTLAAAIGQRSADNVTVRDAADAIVDVTRELQLGIGQILGRLRAPLSTPARSLSAYLAAWRERHPEIRLACQLDAEAGDLPPPIAMVIYRSIQEALTNVVRHACCTEVQIQVTWADDQSVRITIDDNGIGLRATVSSGFTRGSGLGLTGMEERVRQLGGHLSLGLAPTGGTRVRLSIPIAPTSPTAPIAEIQP